MSDSTTTQSGGIGVSGLLLVAFVVLKLCGVIDWSWWWVTAPIWLPTVVVIGLILIGGTITMLAERKS